MFRYALLVFLGACSFGFSSTMVKLTLAAGYNVREVAGAQVFLGMFILWVLFLVGKVSGQLKSKNKTIREPKWKVAVAGFSTGLVTLSLYKCLEYLPASVAIILLMQFVWIGVVLEYVIFKNKPSIAEICSIILVLSGTVFAAGLLNQEAFDFSLIGLGYGLLAATFYSIFLIVNSHVGNSYPSVQKSALMLTGACLIIFVIYPPVFFFNGVFLDGLWKWGLLLSLLSAVVPPLFFAIGIPYIGVPLSSILSSVELPVAVVVAYFILGERVNGLQWIGVLIILSAIVVSNIFKKQKAKP
ncbi:MAG TPA: DMT family transporter [Sphingobacterium sp.]|nr:DMT family transporter [Sphingobacterium sp.]